MISVAEASSIILSHLFRPGTETIELKAACGRILAESIATDRDLPPYDRVSMDGIAIQFSTFRQGTTSFTVEATQAAGVPALALKETNGCIEVMTGAALPVGADTVIRYEDVEIRDKSARVLISDIQYGQNIHPRGQDARKGQEVITPGIQISPAEVALLASVGKSQITVFTAPKTAIISTGDELVDVNAAPLPHQVRRSNDISVQAALSDMGINADTFHLVDAVDILEKRIKSIFVTHSLIILSGGVSKGKFDFVPQVLASLGITKLFHQVSQKPGKPFWFGVSDSHTVFALPGNPVSTYLCFYRYIKPWLLTSMGVDLPGTQAILARDYSFKPALTYFLQVRITNDQGKLLAWPDEGGGSGDFANLRGVHGFLELPLEINEFKAGEAFPFIPFRRV